jgi:hypothetical protein
MSTADARLLALHRLRVKGFAPAAPGSEQLLVGLTEEGLVQRRDGATVSGWRLTPAGLAEDERLVRAELEEAGVRDAVVDAYRDFVALNDGFLGLCTTAQLEGADVADRLAVTHRRVMPVVGRLASALPRFAGYGERFAAALAHVTAGDADYLARPLVDSYHTIWSELHEDLLATLGIARGSETAWLASAK